MNKNIQGDFQICISVPLTTYAFFAKLGTTWKMITLVYYGWVFLTFKDFLRILWCLWMWARVKLSLLQFIVRSMSSPQLFLLSFNVKCYLLFCDIMCYLLFRAWSHMRGATRVGRGSFPLSFFENWKMCPNNCI